METEYRPLIHRQVDEILNRFDGNMKEIKKDVEQSEYDLLYLGAKLGTSLVLAVIGGVMATKMPLDSFNPLIEIGYRSWINTLAPFPRDIVNFITPSSERFRDLSMIPLRGGVMAAYALMSGAGTYASISILERTKDIFYYRGKTKH